MSRFVKRVAFVGFALPEGRFAKVATADPGMPIQTQRFGWAVITALRSSGMDVTVTSTDPVTDFPSNPRFVLNGHRFIEHDVEGTVVPFINVTGLKHLSRFVTFVKALASSFRRAPFDAVVVHGVNSALLWAAASFGSTSKVPFIVLLTDPPGLRTPFDNAITWQLKQLDRRIITSALRRAAGVVALAPRLADDFAPGVPWLHMEGISSELSDSITLGPSHIRTAPDQSQAPEPERVVYAGGLTEAYGVLDLLEAVTRSDGRWCLEIYGRGSALAAIEQAATTSPRVQFGGVVDAEELQRIYSRAQLLVNPRRLDGDMPTYSFPSKLLEYMATGTPVMTTRLPTLPADYEPHVCLTEQGGPELAKSIDSFFAQSLAERIDLGRSARRFILTTRGHLAQGLRLRQFISEVAAPQHRE